jgi:hypothetical protein
VSRTEGRLEAKQGHIVSAHLYLPLFTARIVRDTGTWEIDDAQANEEGGHMPAAHRLAEALEALHWSPDDLAAASKLHPNTIRRALQGVQSSARTRAQILNALNRRRAEQSLPALRPSDVFPSG